jgi:hypothetical protein
MNDLQYPIGTFIPQPFSTLQKRKWLQDFQFLPGLVEQAIENMDAAMLETPYRPNGWNIKQVVHHIADSHINCYCRFKLAYTEEKSAIRPYDEVAWANTTDVAEVPINISITLLYALHTRLYHFLLKLTDADWDKTVFHPASNKDMSMWYLLGMYAWHGKHHVAHINIVRKQYGLTEIDI